MVNNIIGNFFMRRLPELRRGREASVPKTEAFYHVNYGWGAVYPHKKIPATWGGQESGLGMLHHVRMIAI